MEPEVVNEEALLNRLRYERGRISGDAGRTHTSGGKKLLLRRAENGLPPNTMTPDDIVLVQLPAAKGIGRWL